MEKLDLVGFAQKIGEIASRSRLLRKAQSERLARITEKEHELALLRDQNIRDAEYLEALESMAKELSHTFITCKAHLEEVSPANNEDQQGGLCTQGWIDSDAPSPQATGQGSATSPNNLKKDAEREYLDPLQSHIESQASSGSTRTMTESYIAPLEANNPRTVGEDKLSATSAQLEEKGMPHSPGIKRDCQEQLNRDSLFAMRLALQSTNDRRNHTPKRRCTENANYFYGPPTEDGQDYSRKA